MYTGGYGLAAYGAGLVVHRRGSLSVENSMPVIGKEEHSPPPSPVVWVETTIFRFNRSASAYLLLYHSDRVLSRSSLSYQTILPHKQFARASCLVNATFIVQ